MMSGLSVATMLCTWVLVVIAGAAAMRRSARSWATARLGHVVPAARLDGSVLVRRLARSIERVRERRAAIVSPGAIADLLDQTARRCASGESIGAAFSAALDGTNSLRHFGPTARALRSGDTIAAALRRQPVDHPDIAVAVHVLRMCTVHGGNVSESIDRAAATLREREAVAAERRAQGSQARLSARVLTVLPVGFGGWTLLTTRSVQEFFVTPAGAACLVLGLSTNVLGWTLMNRVTRGVR